MCFDLRVLNKEYKEILTLRSKINSLLKVQQVIKGENNNFNYIAEEDFLYLPKPVLVYLLILKINYDKDVLNISLYNKQHKRAVNALKVLLDKLNDKKSFLENLHKIEHNQKINLIEIGRKVPRRVFKSPTHREMAQEIMRKFRERNEKSQKK